MKNNTSTLMVILSAVGIMSLSAGSAVAGSVADLNSDGMVTSEEVVAYVQMNYAKINNNGHAFNAKEAAELKELFDIDG
jgi:competence protein ComGC